MSGWRLGIDFGTTNTVAAVARGDAITLVDIESNGNSRMPSAVFLTEAGDILAGSAAVHQAVFAPERFEPTPKRAIGEGEVFLGDRLMPVADLIAAVLTRVFTEACRQQGETMPDQVVLTHPADWSETRLGVLREALEIGGMPAATLIAEPVAAALRIARTVAPGAAIAVYDFGGGTFDAAVLRREGSGFVVAGPPAGRDPLGGEDIDQRIISHIGEVLGKSGGDAWESLIDPPDVAWRRNAAALRAEVQRAKETLSEVSAVQLWIPGLERDLQLTRTELDELIRPEIDATVETVAAVLNDASVKPKDLAALYLVGGSSRIPLVADALWRKFGIRPSVQDNPKAVVSLGAASLEPVGAKTAATAVTEPLPRAATAPTLALPPSEGVFKPLIAADVRPQVWPAGCAGIVQLILDLPGDQPATIRIRDEPARGTKSSELAQQIGDFRRQRTPGFAEIGVIEGPGIGTIPGVERRFTMSQQSGTIAMVERYAIFDGRALVVAFPETQEDLVATISTDQPVPKGGIASRFAVLLPDGWTASEIIAVRRNGSRHSLTMERTRGPAAADSTTWRDGKTSAFSKPLGRVMRSVTPGRVFGVLDGEVTTLRWVKSGAPMLTKIGTTVHDRDALAVSMTLGHQEQNLFGSLVRHARLHPGAVRAGS